jgi:regulator of cell morphogenesis and NO signaling
MDSDMRRGPPFEAAPARAAPTETAELIAHILERYHATHRREIAELTPLASKVEALHAGHARVPRGLGDLLARIGYEMEAHMQKEEQGLFPMILAEEGDPAMAIEIMRDDHDDHAARLEELAALTGGFAVPDGAGEAWSALYARLGGFATDLREHIRLENDELFPRFGAPG